MSSSTMVTSIRPSGARTTVQVESWPPSSPRAAAVQVERTQLSKTIHMILLLGLEYYVQVISHSRVFLLVLVHAWIIILADDLAGEYTPSHLLFSPGCRKNKMHKFIIWMLFSTSTSQWLCVYYPEVRNSSTENVYISSDSK